MEKLGLHLDVGSSPGAIKQVNPQEARRLSIQSCIQSLQHACLCRDDANCKMPPCQRMKRVVQHTKICKRKTNGDCNICKQLIMLCGYHAKHCQEIKCSIPVCSQIKQKQVQLRVQPLLLNAHRISPCLAASSGAPKAPPSNNPKEVGIVALPGQPTASESSTESSLAPNTSAILKLVKRDAGWSLVNGKGKSWKRSHVSPSQCCGAVSSRPKCRPNHWKQIARRTAKCAQDKAGALKNPVVPEATSAPPLAVPGADRRAASEVTLSAKAIAQNTDGTDSVTATPAKRSRHDETPYSQGESEKQRLGSESKPQRITHAQSASADLAVAITAVTSGYLGQQEVEYILGALTDRLVEESVTRAGSAGPVFKGKPVHASGALKIWCNDAAALEWLTVAISSITLPRGETLVIKRQSELPQFVLGGILLPGTWNGLKAGRALNYQNPWAQIHKWRLLKVVAQGTDTFIIVSLPEDLVGVLMEHERRLALVVGSVYIKFKGPKGRFTVTLTQGSCQHATYCGHN